ncbi:MAG: hypothetical protein J6D21_03605 [Clostridia bacterium]|nr:hypothetical protein [Clostridia bacterium]
MKQKKSIVAVILFVAIFLMFSFSAQALDGRISYSTTTITTPNGTPVTAYYTTEDYSEEEKANSRRTYEERFPGIEFLADPTPRYNCHSYAWYMSSSTNSYWIESIDAYIDDPTYMVTTTPAEGDIIVYFKPDNVPNHSGVIDEVLSGTSNGVCGDANLYMVVSKWSGNALYRHRGDYCPFVREYTGASTYVKYYHMHVYTYTNIDIYTHTLNCRCMEPMEELHNWVQIGIGALFRCSVCGYRSNFTPATPENVPIETWSQLMAKAAMTNGVTFTLDDIDFCYMNGQYYIVTEYTSDVVITPNVME